MPKKNQNKKEGGKSQSTPAPRKALSNDSGAAGRLLNAGISVAKKIPVISDVVNTVESVASSILGFLGLGSSSFEVHYDASGRQMVRLHKHLQAQGLKQSLRLGTGDAGSILMKYVVSIGPEGSRSRIMGQLFEQVQFKQVQLEVLPNCAATEPGQLAYVFVPDVADTSLEEMSGEERVASVLSRESVRLAQIWQNTVLSFPVPQKPYFVRVEDGIERLSSPGVIYVVAITDVNTAMLPTLRQTSRLTFSRATLLPIVNQTEVHQYAFTSAAANPPQVYGTVAAFTTSSNTGRWRDLLVTATVTTEPVSADYTGQVSIKGIKVRKGETIRTVGPSVLMWRQKIVPLTSVVNDVILSFVGASVQQVTAARSADSNNPSYANETIQTAPFDGYFVCDPNGLESIPVRNIVVAIEPSGGSLASASAMLRSLQVTGAERRAPTVEVKGSTDLDRVLRASEPGDGSDRKSDVPQQIQISSGSGNGLRAVSAGTSVMCGLSVATTPYSTVSSVRTAVPDGRTSCQQDAPVQSSSMQFKVARQ